ncbi:serine/threonine protein phosphatase [Rhizobium sp. 32-5/1]|uniref:serine/threonine protein phosphatase n=1 Tax=Rhizobium sp. 32-5/1 TaxID=3019602 RepID=UPI00240D7B83|nr:serine/threonine protein phosphatase [Rhizobium sp. 32-5/1]WEZ84981.1 serine/threonine protein phosphatase [Rhizobium sp. 32-5/1]
MDDTRQGAILVPELNDSDIATMLAALAGGSQRVERVQLSDRIVWIKRYRGSGLRLAARLQGLAARITGRTILRPSPILKPEAAIDREVRQIAAFNRAGFLTPTIFYRSRTALVLSHLGTPISKQMGPLRAADSDAHDALLVRCAHELGLLHSAGLCHGRPHPRDFILDEGRFGFLDFEEEPAAVMPLAVAQARDVWLLFLQIASRCLKPETPQRAYTAWKNAAPSEAEAALRQVMPLFTGFLPLARFLLRLRRGHDLVRFIAATDFLASATGAQPRTH